MVRILVLNILFARPKRNNFPMFNEDYIWQAPDWPQWRYDPKALADPLATVSRAQGLLIGRVADVGHPVQARADGAPQRYYSLSAQIQRTRNVYYDIKDVTYAYS